MENADDEDVYETTILDTSWISDFEKIDKDYETFYLEDLQYVNLTILYINNVNEISKIKEEKFFMKTPNVISREEIIGILKRNNNQNKKTFHMMTILKYNIDLEPLEVRKFLLEKDKDKGKIDASQYLSVIKFVDEIHWNKSITMFHNINNLYIIFYENVDTQKENNTKNNAKNKTKRVYMTSVSLSHHNKTLRKTI
jgi:hypothetical protein